MSLRGTDGRVLAEVPIIQAPMAGVATPALAAAVSEAGALGSLALGASSPARAAELVDAVRARTRRPVNYNVFTHAPAEREAERERDWLETLAPHFRRLGAAVPDALACPYRSFLEDDALLEVLLERRVEIVSFHFGAPRPDQVRRLKSAGAALIGCATRPQEALELEGLGMDLVVLQGVEAGGHRGCFEPDDDACLPLDALLRATRAVVRLPLVVAGGLATGGDVARMMRRGAVGAQLGTAFVPCPESSAHPRHRRALVGQAPRTAITRRISGRPARGIVNDWFEDLSAPEAAAPAYPVAYDVGRALAAASDRAGSERFDVFWAGVHDEQLRALPAAELVATLAEELRAARSVP